MVSFLLRLDHGSSQSQKHPILINIFELPLLLVPVLLGLHFLSPFLPDRYMFKSIDKTALQEIGPRFTLKLRWLRKGLPAVTSGGSVAVNPTVEGEDDDEDDEDEDEEVEKRNQKKGKGKAALEDEGDEGSDEDKDGEDEDDENDDEEEGGDQDGNGKNGERVIPPLNKQGEFEWKWKVSVPPGRPGKKNKTKFRSPSFFFVYLALMGLTTPIYLFFSLLFFSTSSFSSSFTCFHFLTTTTKK